MNVVVGGFAFDRSHKPDRPARAALKRVQRSEAGFARQLRKVARVIRDLTAGYDLSEPGAAMRLQQQLERYAELLHPWAESVAARMIAEVKARDWQNWREASARIGRELRKEIDDTETGRRTKALLDEQTRLITSIPREAAERVREITWANVTEGKRFPEHVAEIMEAGAASKSRAELIARTEVARTASVIAETRAASIGVTHYVWTTAKDSNVRPSHKKLDGKVFAIDDPPLCDPPDYHAHPGQIFNCRCIAMYILDDV